MVSFRLFLQSIRANQKQKRPSGVHPCSGAFLKCLLVELDEILRIYSNELEYREADRDIIHAKMKEVFAECARLGNHRQLFLTPAVATCFFEEIENRAVKILAKMRVLEEEDKETAASYPTYLLGLKPWGQFFRADAPGVPVSDVAEPLFLGSDGVYHVLPRGAIFLLVNWRNVWGSHLFDWAQEMGKEISEVRCPMLLFPRSNADFCSD
jgi:hypothetical protein